MAYEGVFQRVSDNFQHLTVVLVISRQIQPECRAQIGVKAARRNLQDNR